MNLRCALVTLLRILISTPTLSVLYRASFAQGAALLGNPIRNSTNVTADTYYDYEFADDSQELEQTKETSEEIPDPSPLVVSGYNLPENIFNRGKPFYVEKDPLTGKIDFAQKSPTLDDVYDYVDSVHDKSNIDRKDDNGGGHRRADVNQLTPNFHDFLNLPVKYNSAKYVYPLISSSYASTKVQGSVNKFHNHKDYNFKTSTRKPTPASSPTYFSSHNQYFSRPLTTTTTTTTTTTVKPTTTEIYFTTKSNNLLNSGMGHPSFQEEFGDYYDLPAAAAATTTTKKPASTTTEKVEKIYLTTKAPSGSTSTKKTMSLFEQLFGEYDDTVVPVTTTTRGPSLFANLSGNKYNKSKYQKTEKPEYPTTATTTTTSSTTTTERVHNSHAGPNVLSGTNMGLVPDYEYEDYGSDKYEDNVAVQNKPVMMIEEDLTVEPLYQQPTTTTTTSTTTSTTERVHEVKQNYTDYYDYPEEKAHPTPTTAASTSSTTTAPTTLSMKVTSLPLGDNHLTTPSHDPYNRDPIIVATQNLREKLNGEKVLPKPFEKPLNPPSASNVHIAHNQDTVSFIVGNQQSVEGTSVKENPYDLSDSFRPLYGDKMEAEPEASFHLGSAVTIQPLKHSEASLAIGVPVQVPGRVVDDLPNKVIHFPPSISNKVVFPEDEPDLVPPPERELLPLNSQPMYHQLPSDLTPPREPETARPPWDPRPGHFHSGKPEYNRPPRPPAEVAYKRSDVLPNILPQFRPNMHGKPHEKRFNRQPLLERPSNRPVGFFEKLQPPPPPPLIHHRQPPVRRISSEAPAKRPMPEQFSFYHTPPQPPKIASRRSGDDDVETLQMLQAKGAEQVREDDATALVTHVVNVAADDGAASTDKTIYKVYPVNTPLDALGDKEGVVIGTRAEPPLPPSEIHAGEFVFEPKGRQDAPVLKPHPRPGQPLRTDFPYPLERPAKTGDGPEQLSDNQWNAVGSEVAPYQISATLSSYNDLEKRPPTEKPIAVAYTPTTEPPPPANNNKYSMPNMGGPVIPEISHHHPQGAAAADPRLDFEAPFLASDHVDAGVDHQGWAVVGRPDNRTAEAASTLMPYATTGEFDMEHFQPQLEGGFKPIYSLPGGEGEDKGEREER